MRLKRNYGLLASAVLLGIVYGALRVILRPAVDANRLYGIAGVLLGLFICSHPVANMLDIIMYGRYALPVNSSRRRDTQQVWVAVNAFVLFVGWLVIVIGVIQFTARR